jgi:hypothetical protein
MHFLKLEELETPRDDSSKPKAGIVFRKHTEALGDEAASVSALWTAPRRMQAKQRSCQRGRWGLVTW